MPDEIKTKFGFDVTEFKNNISDMNRGIRIAQNNWKAAAGALGDWKESQEGISTRIKSLNDIMELQRAKVEKLTKEYDDLKGSGTASKDALRKLEEQISKANAELGQTAGDLKSAEKAQDNFGKETKDTAKELDDYSDKTDDAGKKTNKFKEFLKDAAGVMGSGIKAGAKAIGASMAAIGGAAAGAGAALFSTTKKAGESADELLTLSAQTGLSVEQLQKMQYASRFVDVELETMTGSMAKLIRSMSQSDTSAQGKAFAELGVQTRMASGELRDSQTVWQETIDALGKVENETQRDALAMQLFGKSAQDLNPLIKAGGDELKRLGDEAKAAGVIMSDDMVKGLGAFDDEMQKLDAQTQGMTRQLAMAFLPAMKGAVTGVGDLVSEISVALSDGFQPEDVQKLGSSIGKKLIDGMKEISKYIPQVVSVITEVLNEAVKVVVAILPQMLPVLMDGAMQLMQGLFDAISANIEPLAQTVTTLLTKFAEFFLNNLPLIIEIGLQMILALANGIAEAIPGLVPQITQVVMSIVDAIIDNLPAFIEAAIQIVLALTMGLIDALPRLIEWLPTIITSIVNAIVDNLPMLIDAAIQIIVALAQALVQNIDKLVVMGPQIMMAIAGGLISAVGKLVEAVPKLFQALADGFKGADWANIGKNIIEGIKNGITGAVNGLVNAAKNAGNAALGGMKKILGISSPSKVFRDQIGINMGLGVAEGIKATTSRVTKAMSTVTDKLKTDIQVNGKVNISGSAQQAVAAPGSGQAVLNIENFYNNTDKDLETLAYQFEFMRKKAAAALGG